MDRQDTVPGGEPEAGTSAGSILSKRGADKGFRRMISVAPITTFLSPTPESREEIQ